MKREKKLLKNTAIIGIGMICTKGISFFLLPLYTALLSTEEYGIVDLVHTIVTLVAYILTLQFEQGIFRYLIDVRDDKEKNKQYISTTFFTTTSSLIIGIFITILISSMFGFEYKYFLIFNITTVLYTSIFCQIIRGFGETVKYTIASFISAVSQIIFNIIFIVGIKWKVEGMLLATILGQLLTCIYAIFSCKIYKYINYKYFNKEAFKKLMKFSLPMIPNTLCWWLVNLSDRFIVSSFINVAANGIYAVANKFPSIFATLTNVFQVSWTENAAENAYSKDRDDYYSKIMNVSIVNLLFLTALIITFIPLIFHFMVNEKFQLAYNHILILLIAGFFNTWANLYGSIFTAIKYTKYIAKTTVYSAIINILINICLIKYIGLYAASISTLIAYIIITIIRHKEIAKKINIRYNVNDLIRTLILLSISIFSYIINNKIVSLIVFIILCLIYIKLNWKLLRGFIYKLIKRGRN